MRKTIFNLLLAASLAPPVFAQETERASLMIDGTNQIFLLSRDTDFAGSAQFPSVSVVLNAARAELERI